MSQAIIDTVTYSDYDEYDEYELLPPGPTGKFPAGKITKNDDGDLIVQAMPFKKRVVLIFGVPITTWGLTPKEARLIAAELLRLAAFIDGGSKTRRSKKRGKQKRE